MDFWGNGFQFPLLAAIVCTTASIVGVWTYGPIAVAFSLIPRILLSYLPFGTYDGNPGLYLSALVVVSFLYYSSVFAGGTRIIKHPIGGIAVFLIMHLIVSAVTAIFSF